MLEAGPELTAVVAVARFSYPIERALRIANGRLVPIAPDQMSKRSQDLEAAYHDAGQFYWVRVAPFLKAPGLLTPDAGALVVPDWQVQDIDTEDDWLRAEAKYRVLQDMAVVPRA
jgi:N-acylneuraminate cytidylyltransferase